MGSPVNHPADQIRKFLEQDTPWTPFSAEFINYALALLVFGIRYPAVFWKTNKALAFLFSLQLVGNGIQNLMAFSAMSIMYKVTSFMFAIGSPKKDELGIFKRIFQNNKKLFFKKMNME